MRPLKLPGPFVRLAVLAVACWPGESLPHHSYAMFDSSRTAGISGTVARLEWRNPHVYLWVYVRNPDAEGGSTLYAFENGAINVLARLGWSKDVVRAGDAIAVTYWPLKDGRPGGHFESGMLTDGRVLRGSGGPRAVSGNASPGERP